MYLGRLQDFIEAGVTAYSVGCTTEDLRKELLNIGTREADLEDTPVSTGSVGIKTKLAAEEVQFWSIYLVVIFSSFISHFMSFHAYISCIVLFSGTSVLLWHTS